MDNQTLQKAETRPFAVTTLEILEKKNTDNKSFGQSGKMDSKTVHSALDNTMVTF